MERRCVPAVSAAERTHCQRTFETIRLGHGTVTVSRDDTSLSAAAATALAEENR